MCDHAHYILYNRVYFEGPIFGGTSLSAKIRPIKNILLYGIIIIGKNVTGRKRAQYVPDVHVPGGGGGGGREGMGRGATCAIAPSPNFF